MVSMAAEKEEQVRINEVLNYGGESSQCLQKFKLYETRANFYMIGRDKSRTCWKVLKINRLEQSELSILEDPTTYSEIECCDLLSRIHEGNKSSGGLKLVTTCYGIVGFIKFLGPYYMILITKRRKIGMICGHSVYSIAKSEMIPLPASTIHSNMDYARNENRYKKLLRTVDLTKNFFFSYSYHVMLSLQKNQSNHESKLIVDETMFVWNEFLTRGIRSQLKKTSWTVALVYGFFKQVRLSVSGREFDLILVARRSRHYAGMRYLKRGVNDKGRVANDVETEQIVIEAIQERSSIQISSVVQHRGSIPLFWSQETSRLNIKPDIILSKKDDRYEATKLHFENLVKRYGNPIIILNLIKTREKKPRESILRSEFANAIEVINKDLSLEHRLKFLHWDLSKYSRSKAVCVLTYLIKVAGNALDLTGFFYFQVPASSWKLCCNDSGNSNCTNESIHHVTKDAHSVDTKDCVKHGDVGRSHIFKPPMFQNGVLRTNCIDCLDRTNVAQYAYGLVSLGHQLRALGYIDDPRIDLDSPLADDLMKIYEAMGDTLALQYGGSAAHNKIFSERRGQWKAATQSQELFRTLQRYYSNAYMDSEKQDGINVFLGHFQPQHGKPALWELDSDQHYGVGRRGFIFAEGNSRPMIKRSFSDGSILKSAIADENAVQIDSSHRPLPVKLQARNDGFPESTPEISPCESDVSYSRYTPSMSGKELFPDTTYLENNSLCSAGRGDSFNCSNFLGADWLSSSANSCEDDSYGVIGYSSPGDSWDEIIKVERSSSHHSAASSLKGQELASGDLSHGGAAGSYGSVSGFSARFVQWVLHGDTLFP